LDLREKFPIAMASLYPRRYVECRGYISPKDIGALLCTGLYQTHSLGGIEKTGNAFKLMYPAVRYLQDRSVPLLFLAPDLMRAVQRTDFDGDIDWVNMRLPYEHGVLVLPHGGLTHPKDGEVAFMIWSRIVAGTYKKPVWDVPSKGMCDVEITTKGAFAMVACLPYGDVPVWYDSNLSTEYRPTLKLRNLFYLGDEETIPSIVSGCLLDSDLTSEDSSFLEDLGVVLFGTLLAMASRPTLFTPESVHHKVPQKNNKPWPRVWSPNIVGQHYRPKSEPRGGTHASPRMHWRRGHFTNQPHGPGKSLRKQLWIEPTLVCGELAKEEKLVEVRGG
jgi:hypothetical protein